jgi:hypothetical protein
LAGMFGGGSNNSENQPAQPGANTQATAPSTGSSGACPLALIIISCAAAPLLSRR